MALNALLMTFYTVLGVVAGAGLEVLLDVLLLRAFCFGFVTLVLVCSLVFAEVA